LFGGASGSLETSVTIIDNSFLGLFIEQFVPGAQLRFSLGLTANDDAGDIPDRFSFFLLDSSGVALPTLAPSGDYFFGADLHSTAPSSTLTEATRRVLCLSETLSRLPRQQQLWAPNRYLSRQRSVCLVLG
jgi:hypothetical protein